jgi:hypothetical protein
MVKRHDMASGSHEISGNPKDYFAPVNRPTSISYPELDNSGRGVGGPIFASMPTAGGTPAMRGQNVSYPNSNVNGIRASINDGQEMAMGQGGKNVGPGAPYRHPVSGQNPSKPIQRKPKR